MTTRTVATQCQCLELGQKSDNASENSSPAAIRALNDILSAKAKRSHFIDHSLSTSLIGWYSHRQRGIREKLRQDGEAEAEKSTSDRSALNAQKSADDGPRPSSVSTWAMLIKRVYEVDPLECPCCGGQMKVVSFIERCQSDVIE
jgi:hypothetical protein